MNRATGAAAARAVDRLLCGGKPATDVCHCDESIELRRRIKSAIPLVIETIAHLGRVPSTTIANETPDEATLALLAARRALSTLETE